MSKADIAALLEKVKAATGPDREIDASIARLMYGPTEASVHARCDLGMHHYTSSLDAIVALIERELPEWRFDLHAPRNGQIWEGVVCERGQSRRISVEHCASGPLALCAAFLAAKLSLSAHSQT